MNNQNYSTTSETNCTLLWHDFGLEIQILILSFNLEHHTENRKNALNAGTPSRRMSILCLNLKIESAEHVLRDFVFPITLNRDFDLLFCFASSFQLHDVAFSNCRFQKNKFPFIRK